MGRVQWLAVFLHCHLSAVVGINTQCYNGYCFIKPDPLTSGDVQKTFTDAQQWCCENDAMLLEIPDEHVQAAVQSYLSNNSYYQYPFLNAQFQQTNWTWADGTKYDNSRGAIEASGNADSRYAYMKFNQANKPHGIYAATVWDTTPRAFICQYPVGLAHACSNVPSCCPTGISLYDGLCIEVNSSSSPWFGARLSCFQRGGDLASLHDIHPSSLDNQLQSGTEYWTGLTNGQWIWQDSGTQMVYSNWQPGSPGSSTCLCLNYGTGLLADCDCGANTRPFICLQIGNSTSTSASRNSSCLGMSTLKSSPSHTTSTPTSSQTTSLSKSSNQTKSTLESSNQTSSVGVAVGVSIGIIVLVLIILAILLIVFRRRCQIGSLFTKLRERDKSKEVPIYQDAADCQSPAQVLPPDTAFSNITYSSPKVGPYEEIHSPDNIYSEPEHDNGNKYSEVSFNPTDVEAGIPTKVEYMELCDDAGVDETAPHEGVTSGNDVVRNSPYDNFVKEPVNSSSPSIELSSPLRNSGSNDDTILLDNELYS